MDKNPKYYVTATALSIALMTTGITQANAANSNKTTVNSKKPAVSTQTVVHTLANLKPIKLTSKSTAALTDLNILTLSDESILTYTITVKNNDSKSLDLIDYWSKVKTVSGTTYSTTLIAQDKEKKKLSAGSSTTLTYVSKIARHLKPSQLVIEVVQWDFNQPNYESQKGKFTIPSTYLTSTPKGQSKTLRITDVPVKAKIDQVASISTGDYNQVNVSVDLHNVGFRIFEDPKVKYVIRTAQGTSYPLVADSTSVDYIIQPQEHRSVNLVSAIPKKVKLDNLELQIIVDDEANKMSLPVATMQLPKMTSITGKVKANTEKVLQVANGKINAKISDFYIHEGMSENSLSIRLSLKNAGVKTVTVPKYEFEFIAAEGYEIPISTPISDNYTLKPQEEKHVTINLSLPKVRMLSPQLFMNLPPAAESKDGLKYLAGVFEMPQPQQLENMIGQSQYIETKEGTFGVTLASVQKLPWIDGDLVSATIRVNNASYKIISLPELTAQMKIDSASLGTEVKLVSSQDTKVLGSGMSTDLHVVAMLPKQLNFQQLEVSLMEKVGESSSEWIRFNQFGLTGILNVPKGTPYIASNQGKKEETKVLRSYVYPGTSTNLVYTELEVKNSGLNQINLGQYTGVYQGSGGQTYNTQSSQVQAIVGPEEKAIVALWAKVPKKVEVSNLRLIVGEGIQGDQASGESKTNFAGYVNAASFELNASQPAVQSGLSGMELFPYTLTVQNVRASLTGSSTVNVNFEYKQTRNQDYIIGEFGHKYLFEFVDSSGRIYEQIYEPEKEMRVTENSSLSFSFNDALFETKTYGTFKLNVYDLFQDQKLLLGSHAGYYTSSQYY